MCGGPFIKTCLSLESETSHLQSFCCHIYQYIKIHFTMLFSKLGTIQKTLLISPNFQGVGGGGYLDFTKY